MKRSCKILPKLTFHTPLLSEIYTAKKMLFCSLNYNGSLIVSGQY